jgi:alkanesulfonate monooxygenase SsuD/methylene tetrahydromethanopterin reductase-like flavin-dependent oxidoreductase (luciferase family)
MTIRLSVAFRSRGHPTDLLISTKKAETSGFRRIWLVEVYETDVLVLASALARSTKRIGLATGVVNSYLRDPFLLAMASATVSNLSRGRFTLGIGGGYPPMGYRYTPQSDSTLTRLDETVTIVRDLLAGRTITFRGKLFSANNLKLGVPPSHPVKVYSAGMGPRTVELAAKRADGVILMLTTRRFVKEARNIIRETLAKRRAAPTTFPIACHLVTCVSRNRKEAENAAKRTLASYITIPTYRDRLKRLGFTHEVQEVEGAIKLRGLHAASEIVSEEMLNQLMIYGTPAECRTKIASYVDAGVSEPVVYPSNPALPFPEDINRTLSLMSQP